MEIIIDGRHAVLKKGSSFDYVSENRAFSEADDFSMAITLPLAGCPENLAIFGRINRKDYCDRHVSLDAIIQDRHFSKKGMVTVVEATEVELKVQFLEGRSVRNFRDDFDEVYLNERLLGIYPRSEPNFPPANAHLPYNLSQDIHAVALPWVYENIPDEVQNGCYKDESGTFVWNDYVKEINSVTYMPYLLFLTKQVCATLGYTCDLGEWEASEDRYLLVCNVLPGPWMDGSFSRALPHWSMSEFFEELEKFLACEFDIDHDTKTIVMHYLNADGYSLPEVRIDNVIDSFTSEISYEDDICKFRGAANIGYKDRGDSAWSMEQCQWLVDLYQDSGRNYVEMANWYAFWEWQMATFGIMGPWPLVKDSDRGSDMGKLIYLTEDDVYLVYKVSHVGGETYPNMYGALPIEVNRFGDRIYDKDSDNNVEVGILPARIDMTDETYGNCLFLSPSDLIYSEDLDENEIRQPVAYSALLNGGNDCQEFYDKIYVAIWSGTSSNSVPGKTASELPPCPQVDNRLSLRNRYKNYLGGIQINTKEKLKIQWLSKTIPNVRSIFFINGRKYLCEKITATFSEDGMSELLKGEFYPIIDASS